jgi:hypothetical protein
MNQLLMSLTPFVSVGLALGIIVGLVRPRTFFRFILFVALAPIAIMAARLVFEALPGWLALLIVLVLVISAFRKLLGLLP